MSVASSRVLSNGRSALFILSKNVSTVLKSRTDRHFDEKETREFLQTKRVVRRNHKFATTSVWGLRQSARDILESMSAAIVASSTSSSPAATDEADNNSAKPLSNGSVNGTTNRINDSQQAPSHVPVSSASSEGVTPEAQAQQQQEDGSDRGNSVDSGTKPGNAASNTGQLSNKPVGPGDGSNHRTIPEGSSTSKGAAESTSVANATTAASAKKDMPLPADLRTILIEIAKTGSCPWLPWSVDGDGKQPPMSIPKQQSQQAPLHPSQVAQQQQQIHHASQLSGGVTPGAVTSSSSAFTLKRHLHAAAQQHHHHHPHHHHHQQSQPSHSSHRRFQASSSAGSASGPPRKKLRNGLHSRASGGSKTKRRLPDGGSVGSTVATATATTTGTASGGTGTNVRKRPLFLIRTSSSASTASSVFSPGSVGSGRTSGSEQEDTCSQYDSEGTTATSNSDFSFDRNLRKRMAKSTYAAMVLAPTPPNEPAISTLYKCQRDAIRTAMQLALDHFYKTRGGYRLSPAEKRRNATLLAQSAESENKETKQLGAKQASGGSTETAQSDSLRSALSPEEIFRQRRYRLLHMLEAPTAADKGASKNKDGGGKLSGAVPSRSGPDNGPPFTIQRIAEVLVSPERYYTQTHKLCNCLEKLMLITSSTNDFGGIFGGDTSQSRRENREMAALAEEQERLMSELRHRGLRRRPSSSASNDPADSPGSGTGGTRVAETGDDSKKNENSDGKAGDDMGASGRDGTLGHGSSDAHSREMLEAAARASLRTKFDHVGIDPHSSAVVNRDVLAIAENRGMTNSPPPPNLSMAAAASTGLGLPGHTGLLRHGHDQEHHTPGLGRTSPILFSPGSSETSASASKAGSPPMGPMRHHHSGNAATASSASGNVPLLHMHHAASLAGVSPFELASLHHSPERGSPSPLITSAPAPTRDVDIEARSPASSDVDSESDVSFDDSASDRSDGSDSGHYNEAFSAAARAMALSRMQQQQRLQQSRLLTSMHYSGGGSGSSAGGQGNEALRLDTEYQSGDSIDSTRAEDSGGSDSSSSDLAD